MGRTGGYPKATVLAPRLNTNDQSPRGRRFRQRWRSGRAVGWVGGSIAYSGGLLSMRMSRKYKADDYPRSKLKRARATPPTMAALY